MKSALSVIQFRDAVYRRSIRGNSATNVRKGHTSLPDLRGIQEATDPRSVHDAIDSVAAIEDRSQSGRKPCRRMASWAKSTWATSGRSAATGTAEYCGGVFQLRVYRTIQRTRIRAWRGSRYPGAGSAHQCQIIPPNHKLRSGFHRLMKSGIAGLQSGPSTERGAR